MLCQQDPPRKVAPLIGWNVVKTVIKRIQDRNRYALIVLRGLVKTDFKLRYQGSFLGVAWSVLKPLMLFAVMYMVFAKFLRMIHFPNYIVVVSATVGSMISLGINYIVVLIFALFNHVHFTWRVLLLPLNVLQLWVLALALALIFSTMYAYFRDIAHIWEVLQQILFYAMPIIYPLSYVTDKGGFYASVARLELLNPIAQTIQDIRHNFIAPESQPTVWNQFSQWWVQVIPLALTVILIVVGVYVFRRNSKKFAEVM